MKNPNHGILLKKQDEARAKLSLTFQDGQLIANEAYGVYQQVAYDIPAETKRGTIRRSTLIEVCLDAGRLQKNLEDKKRKDLSDIVNKADYDTLIDLVGTAFRYAEYEAGPAE